MKKNNKGFTLVELIVVLVILAILAAILVPALLGWIDKAREKQATTNAEAAYVAAQGLATEYYGVVSSKKPSEIAPSDVQTYASAGKIRFLTDIDEAFSVTITSTGTGKEACKITQFVYTNAEYEATWKASEGGSWTVVKKATTGLSKPDVVSDTTSGK